MFRTGPPPDYPLFDVHLNVLPQGCAAPAGFYRTMGVEHLDDVGVAEGCVMPPALPNLGVASLALRDWAAGHSRWRPLARLGGRRGPRPVTGLWQAREVARAVIERSKEGAVTLDGFAGVKLMPHRAGVPERSVLDDIGRRRLPVLVHCGEMCPPAWIERNLLPYLQGPVILAHLGSWPCSADLLQAAVDLALRIARIFLETSGASIGNFLAFAASRVPDKLMFGSNAPMCPPAVQWAHVAAAVADDRVLERVAHRNARALFA